MVVFFVQLHFTTRVRYGFLSVQLNYTIRRFGRYEKSFRKLLATTASEIMTRDVRCVTPDTDMDTITTLMVDEHLKTVPVVEKPKKDIKVKGAKVPVRLVGIITRHDILGAIAAIEAEEALKEIGKDKGAEKSDNGSNANDKEK